MQDQCSFARTQRIFAIGVVVTQRWSIPRARYGCHRRCFKRDGVGCKDIIDLLPFPDAIV